MTNLPAAFALRMRNFCANGVCGPRTPYARSREVNAFQGRRRSALSLVSMRIRRRALAHFWACERMCSHRRGRERGGGRECDCERACACACKYAPTCGACACACRRRVRVRVAGVCACVSLRVSLRVRVRVRMRVRMRVRACARVRNVSVRHWREARPLEP
eukprot:3161200-Pleurochrysis_carterae.AAC.1